jgi:hypothetical protein
VSILLMGNICEASYNDMLYIPNFTKFDTEAEATLRFCLSNSRCRNFGITDGKDL